MSIGEVLGQLRGEFPDVTISKIRFLETEGLVEPQRTASGYRKFSRDDVGRLRYVLAAQRDNYLPLRVIKAHLEAIDRGLQPPADRSGRPAGAARPGRRRRPARRRRLPARGLRAAALPRGADRGRRHRARTSFTQIEGFGLVEPPVPAATTTATR